MFAIEAYFFKHEVVDCEQLGNDALKYYKKEVVPRYNTTELPEHLNVYLEMSVEFYVCVRDKNEIENI